MDRQISRLVSNRPEGVRKRNDGGRSGYVGGRMIRPWYAPCSYGELGGPRMVKCHSNRLVSSGDAWYSFDGCVLSSDASRTVLDGRRRALV